jgi:predicted nucleic acid-binding Zn ribbon protein
VTKREPSPLKELLPRVLGRLARESGGGERIAPVWDELLGPSVSRNARPWILRDGVLVVRVTSLKWAETLRQQAPELLERLGNKLGAGTVTRLEFELTAKP